MRRVTHLAAAAALAGAFVGAIAAPSTAQPPEARYRVTITNLTSGQPLTPPVVATHRQPLDVFTVGQAASPELQAIAENGNNAPLVDLLSSDRHVRDVVEATSGPLVPDGTPGSADFGDSVVLELDAGAGAQYLSLAAMLICTNDGFTGVDALRLPRAVGDSVTVHTNGYDAGTELNTEDFADIVPPCQGLIGVSSGEPGSGETNPDLAQGSVIAHHPGIAGGADLVPGVHGWADPVAEVTVERIA